MFRRIKKTPTILQLEAAECGAASLGMVLGHFGRFVPLEHLRLMCGVSRDGSKASSLLKAARSYGLDAKGLKAEPEHLRDLKMPAIAFVDFCHFLVIEGVVSNKVYLNDPANGRQKIHLDEFDARFTGVVLTFSPNRDFVKSDERPSLKKALLARTAGVKSGIVYVLLASFALVLPGLVLPILSQTFVDYVLVRNIEEWLMPLILGMTLTALVRFVLIELQNWSLTRTETRLAVDGARQLLLHIFRLPISFFGTRYVGEIAGRLGLSDGLAVLLTGEVAGAVLSLITAIFFLALMLVYDVWIALVVLVLSMLNIFAVSMTTRFVSDGYRKLSIDAGKLSGIAMAGLRDIESFKAAGAESSFFARWAGLHANVVSARQLIDQKMILLNVAPQFLGVLTTATVLIGGGIRVMQGEMTIGMLVAFQTLAASFLAPTMALASMATRLQEIRSFTERTNDVLHQTTVWGDNEAEVPIDRLPQGHITIKDLGFGYLPLEPLLISNFHLEVKSGTSVALVGSSGSGKSTLGRLITGLYEPATGQVIIDGCPLIEWPRDALAGSIAYIDQDIVLFEGTVRDNLSLWDKTIPEAQLVKAAQDAQIHDLIASRPGTYDSIIEEAGRNFSGGQRQRIEIARALATKPRILVMDEATSALDTVTEAKVVSNILARGITLIIIAHRLSTIRDCDEIIVLEQGEPVERGTHKTLMALDGRYVQLIEA